MYTIKITKKVIIDRNLCDHIWVEEVFLTKLEVVLKALFTRMDGEIYRFADLPDEVVREYRTSKLE